MLAGFNEITTVKIALTLAFEVALLVCLYRYAIRGESRRRRAAFWLGTIVLLVLQSLAGEILFLNVSSDDWLQEFWVLPHHTRKKDDVIEVVHVHRTDPLGLVQRFDVLVLDRDLSNRGIGFSAEGWGVFLNGVTYEGRRRAYYRDASGTIHALGDGVFDELVRFCDENAARASRNNVIDKAWADESTNQLMHILENAHECPALVNDLRGE